MRRPKALFFPTPLLLVLLAALLSGCATSGVFNSVNATRAELAEANYEVVATNVQGKASAGYLLGVSAGPRGQLQTLALARVSGSGQLYGDALESLWANFEAEHEDAEERSLALVNVRYDTDALNLLLYTQPTIFVRADVVEFQE